MTKIKILRRTICGRAVVTPGKILEVPDATARRLVAMRKAELHHEAQPVVEEAAQPKATRRYTKKTKASETEAGEEA